MPKLTYINFFHPPDVSYRLSRDVAAISIIQQDIGRVNQIRLIHKSVKSVIQTKEILIKATGGELKVNTKEVEGTVFTIILPL